MSLALGLPPFFRGYSAGSDCTGVFLDLTPNVRCVSWHAPTNAQTSETFAQSIDAVDRCLDELAIYGSDSKVIMGVDLNCQLEKRETCVGDMAAGERPTEHERADLVYGFLARRVLRAASTFNRSGSTRVGLGLRGEKEAPSQIDFVFCSQGIAAANAEAWIDGALETDHFPVCQHLVFLPVSGRQRCRMYKEEVERKDRHLTLPLQWKPRDLGKFRDLLRRDFAQDVWSEMERIRVLAAGEQKQHPKDGSDYLQRL